AAGHMVRRMSTLETTVPDPTRSADRENPGSSGRLSERVGSSGASRRRHQMRSTRSRSLLALAAAAALTLTACGSSSEPRAASADPVDGGTLTIAIDSDPGSQFDI